MRLGQLQLVDVRTIWQHEASDFTPWLAASENINVLGEALRTGPLDVEAVERNVGRFSADVVARDEAGTLILIENQLEQTDHRHLGQILTYLAGLEEDATVVWIATRFSEEHRAALDWLNENTSDRFEFFGVELRVVRIGQSDAAPEFSIVAKPNNWSRSVRSAARQASQAVEGDRQKLLLSYWTSFAEYIQAKAPSMKSLKPSTDHWKTFGVGKTGFNINVNALTQEKRLGVELYISHPNAKRDFSLLESQRSFIEADAAQPLRWEPLPNRKGARISVEPLAADPADQANWPVQHEWMFNNLNLLRRVFANRIRQLAGAVAPSEGMLEEV